MTIALATVACAGHLATTAVVSAGRPVYPDSLRALGIEGRVVVQVVVDSTGQAEPGTATVLRSTYPGFNQAAIDFVNAARFRPARYHGRAVLARSDRDSESAGLDDGGGAVRFALTAASAAASPGVNRDCSRIN